MHVRIASQRDGARRHQLGQLSVGLHPPPRADLPPAADKVAQLLNSAGGLGRVGSAGAAAGPGLDVLVQGGGQVAQPVAVDRLAGRLWEG